MNETSDPQRLATVRVGKKRVLRLFADWEVKGRFLCVDDAPGLIQKSEFDDVNDVIEFFSRDEAGRELLRRAKLVSE